MKTISLLGCLALGLMISAPQARASVNSCTPLLNNLVSNCGFEAGNFSFWNLTGNDVPLGEGNLYGVEGMDPDGISPNSGSYQAYFGDLVANATTLSQTLSTVAGETYTLSFSMAQDTTPGTGMSPDSNEFLVSFGGTSVVSLANVAVQPYTFYTYQVTAISASTVLSFTMGNDLGYFLLDDISVITPEPSSLWMIGGGLLCLGSVVVRRKTVTPLLPGSSALPRA